MPVIRTSSPYTIHGTSSAATFGSSPYLRRSSPTAQSGLLSAFEFADASPRASQDARREIHRRDALEGHEHEILEARRQQKNASNLSTIDLLHFMGTGEVRLMTYGYPVDASGDLIDPNRLDTHSKTTTFPAAHCFHGLRCRFFQPRSGELQDKHVFACHYLPGKKQCTFYVIVEEVLKNPNIRYEQYSPLKARKAKKAPTPSPSKTTSTLSSSPSSRPSSQRKPLKGLKREHSIDSDIVVVTPPRRKVISISSSSSGSGNADISPPTAYMKGKGKKLSVDEDIFGVLGGSPSGSTKWPGSQPIASTSKGNLFVKHEDSPPVVSEPSSGTGKKFYRNFQYSGHSLLHPSPDSKGSYDKALELWTPPPIIRLSPVAYEVPASGLEKFEEALLSGEGVPSQEFWNIFERCPTCGRVVYGPKMHMHNICDLTHL
ncbi:hypothetical protein HWV62_45579 [Athelia sp. TMB]|nr:hypothetical protein HWV62_45579 [Athelia sp. TMB]